MFVSPLNSPAYNYSVSLDVVAVRRDAVHEVTAMHGRRFYFYTIYKIKIYNTRYCTTVCQLTEVRKSLTHDMIYLFRLQLSFEWLPFTRLQLAAA